MIGRKPPSSPNWQNLFHRIGENYSLNGQHCNTFSNGKPKINSKFKNSKLGNAKFEHYDSQFKNKNIILLEPKLSNKNLGNKRGKKISGHKIRTQKINITTFNCRGLVDEARFYEFEKMCENLNFDVIGLLEILKKGGKIIACSNSYY